MLRLATTTKTSSEPTDSPVESPSTASAAPADAASIRFFGFTPARSKLRPNALGGVRALTPAIHFGISGVVPGAGQLRQFRAASSKKSTPNTILPHAMVSAAVLLVAASPWSARV